VKLRPANFTARIDNPCLPLRPGSRWVYREGRQRVVVTVTRRTRVIAGIRARVVHDVASLRGRVVEDTYDWYAQDRRGNVWYMGEATKEFSKGKAPDTSGSWEAGVNGAQAGVAMPARPHTGLTYRQEYLEGEAEDAARVLGTNERASAPLGSFRHVLLTRDYTPLEPDLVEYKLYARGVGQVLAVTVSGGSERHELLRFTKGG
jgi:hypothetical protein